MTKRIPIEFLVEPELFTIPATMAVLGFKSRTTLWKETALGKIKQCSYGRYHISEIRRYAANELKLVRTINLTASNQPGK